MLLLDTRYLLPLDTAFLSFFEITTDNHKENSGRYKHEKLFSE
jgi:hypothetical protein